MAQCYTLGQILLVISFNTLRTGFPISTSLLCVCVVWKTKTNSDRRKKRTRDNLVYWEYQRKSWEGTRKWEEFFLLPSAPGVFSSFLFNTFLTGVQVGQGLPEKPNRPPFDLWQGINRFLVEHIRRDGLKWERMWFWTKVFFDLSTARMSRLKHLCKFVSEERGEGEGAGA